MDRHNKLDRPAFYAKEDGQNLYLNPVLTHIRSSVRPDEEINTCKILGKVNNVDENHKRRRGSFFFPRMGLEISILCTKCLLLKVLFFLSHLSKSHSFVLGGSSSK